MNRPVFAADNQIDLQALSHALGLAVGERAELVDTDAKTGEYRVFYVALEAGSDGGVRLAIELHRQTPQLKHWLFELLAITLGAPSANGLCAMDAFESDATISLAGFPSLLPSLAQMIADIKQGIRPENKLLRPFFSRAAYVRWIESKSSEGAL